MPELVPTVYSRTLPTWLRSVRECWTAARRGLLPERQRACCLLTLSAADSALCQPRKTGIFGTGAGLVCDGAAGGRVGGAALALGAGVARGGQPAPRGRTPAAHLPAAPAAAPGLGAGYVCIPRTPSPTSLTLGSMLDGVFCIVHKLHSSHAKHWQAISSSDVWAVEAELTGTLLTACQHGQELAGRQ